MTPVQTKTMPANWSSAGSMIGRNRHEITTPALLLDLPVVRRNIERMAERMNGPARLRPHAKSHKCAQLARLQIAAGAIGLTAATVWEAAALAAAGIEDILIANEVVHDNKILELTRIASCTRVTVAVDDLNNARKLSDAATKANNQLGVLIDVDIGLRRCGVRSAGAARELALRVSRLPHLQLRGVMGYEGHCALEPDRPLRERKTAEAMLKLAGAAGAIRAAGLPVEVISAGGTGTYDLTGSYPGITEIQAGSYVFMDAARQDLVPEFSLSLTVLATVVSRQDDTLVVDAGKKTIGVDFALPRPVGFEAKTRYVSEEHTVFDIAPNCALVVGQPVEVVPGYCPTTINLHDVYHVIENGKVVEIWPVLARGPGGGVST
jgi:D-serine deaminase-like pyridoxal phosphate-dependent protein